MDADATAFITATGITDTTQKNAINTLVLNLKSYGIWSKAKAIYPFVGGTATTHKYNLKNPLDTDAAFRLLFNGGWTHSSGGVLPNGTTAWANTFLKPSLELSQDSASLGSYLRGPATPYSPSGIHIGCANSDYSKGLYTTWTFDPGSGNEFSRNNNNLAGSTLTDKISRGFIQNYRTSSTNMKVLKDNSTSISNTNATTGLAAHNIYIGAMNLGGTTSFYNNIELAFSSICTGLTDTEANNFYTAVQAFQTTLARQL